MGRRIKALWYLDATTSVKLRYVSQRGKAYRVLGAEREVAVGEVERAREEDERACSVCFVEIW